MTTAGQLACLKREHWKRIAPIPQQATDLKAVSEVYRLGIGRARLAKGFSYGTDIEFPTIIWLCSATSDEMARQSIYAVKEACDLDILCIRSEAYGSIYRAIPNRGLEQLRVVLRS